MKYEEYQTRKLNGDASITGTGENRQLIFEALTGEVSPHEETHLTTDILGTIDAKIAAYQLEIDNATAAKESLELLKQDWGT